MPEHIGVRAAVIATLTFMRNNRRRALPAILLYAATAGYMAVVVRLHEDDTGAQLRAGILLGLGFLAVVAALLRFAMRDARPTKWWGLDFGMDELRLLGAYAVAILFFLCVMLAGVVITAILLVVVVGVEAAGVIAETPGAIVLALPIMIVMTWIWCRLSLYPAAVIDRRRVVFIESWSWTRTHAGAIFVAMFLLVMPWRIAALLLASAMSAISANAGPLVVWLCMLPPALCEVVGLFAYVGVISHFYRLLAR